MSEAAELPELSTGEAAHFFLKRRPNNWSKYMYAQQNQSREL